MSHYFSWWNCTGTWTALNNALRTAVRIQAGREPTPSAGAIDSQSVKATEVGVDFPTNGERSDKSVSSP